MQGGNYSKYGQSNNQNQDMGQMNQFEQEDQSGVGPIKGSK